MIHINILTRSTNDPYYPNWDKNRFPETEYDIRTNCADDIEWDCVIVSQNLESTTKLRCREGNLLYMSGEPPLMLPCPNTFTKQFDCVLLPHQNVRHRNKILSHGFLSWTLGRGFKSKTHRYDYEALKNLEPPKTKLISIVSSNQTMMPGHSKRVAIIEQLQRDFPGIIDVFGRGYKFVDFKADALLPYRFHICIENSSIPYYWTEKISDPVMAQCVPIYSGCTNIEDYIGSEGYFKFDVTDYDSLKSIIEKIIVDPDGEYSKKKKALEEVRRTIMEKENIIPFAIDYVNKHPNGCYKDYTIKTLNDNWEYKYDMWVIRLKRFIYKKYFQLFKKNK